MSIPILETDDYKYDVHFDATNLDGTGCHFVFPVTNIQRALDMQRDWFKTYQDINTLITTVIKPHVPKAKAA